MNRLLGIALLALAVAPAPLSAQAMVSAADPRAAQAGVEILRKGGTAADAAVAMMAALGVVEPGHSGLGGGGFLIYYDARTRKLTSYDAREAAPKAATPDWFFGPDGKPLPHDKAIPGGRSVGVPGQLRLMEAAHRDHGKLAWARLFDPAITLAAKGWAITPRFYNFIATMGRGAPADFFSSWSNAYLRNSDGSAKPVGTTVTNPDLAATLRRVATMRARALYAGPVARDIVATVDGATHLPSRMTEADLADYRVRDGKPLCGHYRGYRLCTMGPPSSGVTMLQILAQLERFDLAKLGKDSPVAWHLFAESSQLAYADRDAYVADPAFVSVPVAGLLAPDYIARRSALISPDHALAEIAPGNPAGAPAFAPAAPQPEHGTTDLVAVDRWGNIAEVTTTIESVFGSGLTSNGFFLNNELTDFNLDPVQNGLLTANRVEGGKRPRSSMSPTIVFGPDGKVRLALGAAGGSTIIAQVAKAIIGVVDWHLSAQDAIALGLVYAPGQTVLVEKGTTAEPLAPAMQALGDRVFVAPLGLKANAIEFIHGKAVGAADPRSEGVAMDVAGHVYKPKPAAALPDRPSE